MEKQELISVCSWCKRTKIDGTYVHTELYKEHKNITHGLCIECKNQLLEQLKHEGR